RISTMGMFSRVFICLSTEGKLLSLWFMHTQHHLWHTFRAATPPLHRAGWPFVAGFAVASLLLGLLWAPLGWLGLISTGWCAYFFRDPVRVTPLREGLIVSPADGIVQTIASVTPPLELDIGLQERTRISIFLNVFDVHVNRIPHEGSI